MELLNFLPGRGLQLTTLFMVIMTDCRTVARCVVHAIGTVLFAAMFENPMLFVTSLHAIGD